MSIYLNQALIEEALKAFTALCDEATQSLRVWRQPASYIPPEDLPWRDADFEFDGHTLRETPRD